NRGFDEVMIVNPYEPGSNANQGVKLMRFYAAPPGMGYYANLPGRNAEVEPGYNEPAGYYAGEYPMGYYGDPYAGYYGDQDSVDYHGYYGHPAGYYVEAPEGDGYEGYGPVGYYAGEYPMGYYGNPYAGYYGDQDSVGYYGYYGHPAGYYVEA